ncbi:MAG: hypothetical protein ACRDLS_00040 [Solirubrobacteraceae bacterium]
MRDSGGRSARLGGPADGRAAAFVGELLAAIPATLPLQIEVKAIGDPALALI